MANCKIVERKKNSHDMIPIIVIHLMYFCVKESEEECDDEELQKWNEEENRKQLEKNEDDGQDSVVHANTSSKLQHSIDESTMASARTGCSSVDLFHEEDESKHDSCFSLELRETVQWEETSTIPSGQGDAVTFDGKGRVEANTPFTKLFNGRSRYHSYSNDHSKMSAETPVCWFIVVISFHCSIIIAPSMYVNRLVLLDYCIHSAT